MEIIIAFLKSAFTIMIPIFFAASGGLFPSLAGTLNIALEGLLLAGAFSSLTVYYFTGNAAGAVFAAVIASVALSLLHTFAAFKLRANLFISGLAINLFSSGLCIVLSEKIFKTKGVVSVSVNSINQTQNLFILYIILGLFLLLASWLTVYKTPFGYRLRACDNNKEALISLGINPVFYQSAAIIISGFFCGIAGSFLSLNLGAYVPGMSAGKGWIALAVIFLGARKPLGILAAAFIFAAAESFSNYAQGFLGIPVDFILAFPYVFTLIALLGVSVVTKNKK
ncbi:MAG: ABC transporter permease [Treponema sp.]|nr:ABC transporter permease [Treponema sp.]MCL2250924.1 ABC transporter permease [Treponema sp.]